MEDVRIEEFFVVFICFYEEYYCYEKIIELFIEIFVKYCKYFGYIYCFIIKIMYFLVVYYMFLGCKEGYDIYIEIVVIFNKGWKYCYYDVIKVVVILIYFYKERQ